MKIVAAAYTMRTSTVKTTEEWSWIRTIPFFASYCIMYMLSIFMVLCMQHVLILCLPYVRLLDQAAMFAAVIFDFGYHLNFQHKKLTLSDMCNMEDCTQLEQMVIGRFRLHHYRAYIQISVEHHWMCVWKVSPGTETLVPKTGNFFETNVSKREI